MRGFLIYNNMKNTIVLSVIVLIISSCGLGREKEEVIIEGKYKMKVPTNMSETFDLNDDASLQYQNLFNELYLIVIDEDLADFNASLEENELEELYSADLEGHCNLLIDAFAMEVDITNESEPVDLEINGLPAKQVELEAYMEGLDVYYCYTFIEGKNNFYQILSWTLLDEKDQHAKILKKIPLTFEEL